MLVTPEERPGDGKDALHPDSKRVRCEECGAMLPDSKALMVHVETAHVRGNL